MGGYVTKNLYISLLCYKCYAVPRFVLTIRSYGLNGAIRDDLSLSNDNDATYASSDRFLSSRVGVVVFRNERGSSAIDSVAYGVAIIVCSHIGYATWFYYEEGLVRMFSGRDFI